MAEKEFVVDGDKLVFDNYTLKFEEKDGENSILGFSLSSEDETKNLSECVQFYDAVSSIVGVLKRQIVEYGLAKLSDDNHEAVEFDSEVIKMTMQAMGHLILSLNNLGEIYIPETVNDMPVTSIAEHAFDSKPVGALNAPSVRYIGDFAFCYCRFLQSINLPNVEYIGENAFAFNNFEISLFGEEQFNNFNHIYFPNVKYIGECAFLRNKSLRHIYCPHIEEIAKFAFFDCKALTSVSLGNTLRKITVGAFNPTDRLTIYYSGSYNDFLKVNVEDADMQSPNFSSWRNVIVLHE